MVEMEDPAAAEPTDRYAMHLTTKKSGPCIARDGDKQRWYVADGPGPREVFAEDIRPVPYQLKGQRSAIYIVGASGSGKSTYIARALKYMKKDKPCYLFTTAEELDPVFDPERVKMVNYMDNVDALSTLQVSELQGSICIFDDFDASTDPNVNRAVGALLKAVLETGRKLEIDLFCVSHNPRDYVRTRTLILESPTFVVFPQTNRSATTKFLKEYYDDDKAFLESVKRLNDGGRFTFCTLHKNVPRYMITNGRIKLLD